MRLWHRVPMDTLMGMKVFREVVERGTFVAAAERLSLSTAMASKHVMNVERRLGARLLNRSSRSLSLTEPGRIYFERCKAILEKLEQAESALGSFGGAPRGTLRITCPSWMGTRRMAEFLAEHRARYPQVVLDVTFEDRWVDIVAEGYDLAVRALAGSPPEGLIARALPAVPLVIAASTEYLRRHGTPQLPSELAHHDSVIMGNGHSWHFTGPNGGHEGGSHEAGGHAAGDHEGGVREGGGHEAGRHEAGGYEVAARVVLRLSSTTAVAHAISTGIGVAALPLTVIEDPQFKDVLRPILTKYPLRQPTLFALYAARRLMPPKLRTFIDHLVEQQARTPPAAQPRWSRSN